MQALRVERLSDDLSGASLIDLPEPVRAPGEVLVRVRAASLNFPDLLMTRGEYQFKPAVPFTSGLEFAGEVLEADPGSGFAPGDKVMGGNKTGAFAEIASVSADKLSAMPRGMDFPAAAAMGAAYSTAYTGLVELGGLQARPMGAGPRRERRRRPCRLRPRPRAGSEGDCHHRQRGQG